MLPRPLGRRAVFTWACVVAISTGVAAGCVSVVTQPPPSLSGPFQGSTPDGRPVTVTFVQEGHAVTGRGVLGGRDFVVSGLTSWYGPMVFSFQDGATAPAQITLSPDGSTAVIRGLGAPVPLERGGAPAAAGGGAFAGRYATPGPPAASLTLGQGGELVSGIGLIDGRPVAVVGRVTGRRAVGTMLYSDESRSDMTATLSADGRTLSVRGLGAAIELARQ